MIGNWLFHQYVVFRRESLLKGVPFSNTESKTSPNKYSGSEISKTRMVFLRAV